MICLVAGIVYSPAVHAGKHHRPPRLCCQTCGQEVCKGTAQLETYDQTVFDCKTERVCIPPVRFPWESGKLKCGWIREVAVLSRKKVERKQCVWDWNVQPICPDCQQEKPTELESIPMPPAHGTLVAPAPLASSRFEDPAIAKDSFGAAIPRQFSTQQQTTAIANQPAKINAVNVHIVDRSATKRAPVIVERRP
jgi:hypothetical protein